MSILKTLNHLYSNTFMEFLKDPSLILYSSSYLYTTPLSTVISNSAANHHLYLFIIDILHKVKKLCE